MDPVQKLKHEQAIAEEVNMRRISSDEAFAEFKRAIHLYLFPEVLEEIQRQYRAGIDQWARKQYMEAAVDRKE